MVSPPYKDGYGVSVEGIAPGGGRVLGDSLGSFAGAPGEPQTRITIGLIYQFDRAPQGWVTSPLTPANPTFRSASTFAGATDDLSRTIFNLPTAPVGQDDFYLRTPLSLVDVGPVTPPADGPTVEPGPVGGGPPAGAFRLEAASADSSHLVFGLRAAFGWPGDLTTPGELNVYQYLGTGNAAPVMVGVKGGPGSTELEGQCGTYPGTRADSFNAVSESGDTVFFTPAGESHQACGLPQPAVDEVFARLGGAVTVNVSEPSPGSCHAPCGTARVSDAVFAGASDDGQRVFFLSTRRLTDPASEDETPEDSALRLAGSGCQDAHGSGCNLYEYDFSRPAGERLVAVSAGSASPQVQGMVRISQDGSHVYFVARGVLTGTPNGTDQQAQMGANNLYVFDTTTGTTRFVVSLAPSEGAEGGLTSSDEELWGGVSGSDAGRPAQTTPDGRVLVFQSRADLTPDDTSKRVWQIFEYEADTGALRRVSKGNEGFNDNGNTERYSAEIVRDGYGESRKPGPQPLTLSDDGSKVFFQSADPLVAGMSVPASGQLASSVYEYTAGHVSLIYGGSATNVSLNGVSASGQDVYFETADRLLPEDTDTQRDIYDARIAGGLPRPPGLAECSGEGCRAAAPPVTPPSLPGSFLQAPGENLTPLPPLAPKPSTRAQRLAKALKACRTKRNRHKRSRCERQARKRYGASRTFKRTTTSKKKGTHR